MRDSGEEPKLSFGQSTEGENRVPFLRVRVKLAEGANGQAQLCPADKCPPEGGILVAQHRGGRMAALIFLLKPRQGALSEIARELAEREFSKDRASKDLNTVR